MFGLNGETRRRARPIFAQLADSFSMRWRVSIADSYSIGPRPVRCILHKDRLALSAYGLPSHRHRVA